MNKSIIIIGAGQGLSAEIAKKFGREGYQVGLICRKVFELAEILQELKTNGVTVYAAPADAGRTGDLEAAITFLKAKLDMIGVLVYNAAVIKQQDVLAETRESLLADLNVNIAGALDSVKILYEDLKQTRGAVIFTGGGLAIHPDPAYGSLAIGKAGLRNLAYQLNCRLAPDGVYAGTITINGSIAPSSETYSPAVLAELFWELATNRDRLEIAQ